MKAYVTPTVNLLYTEVEDILTVSDPTMDDMIWGEIALPKD